MEILDFESFLKQKKIDPVSFLKDDQALYEEFRNIFEQMHPDSFTAQKLFLINRIRRKYPFTAQPSSDSPAPTAAVKPRMPFRPKIGG